MERLHLGDTTLELSRLSQALKYAKTANRPAILSKMAELAYAIITRVQEIQHDDALAGR
jgi:hypothetical protein